MTPDALFTLLAQAHAHTGHTDYVVIGSLSILGLAPEPIPPGMAVSIDLDCYTRADPGRIFDLAEVLGEGSAYHLRTGYFLDPVSPALPTLPEGWADRLLCQERVVGGVMLRAWCLEPHDAAVSKYARGEPRDLRWIEAGVKAQLIALGLVQARMRDTRFLDDEEQARALRLLEQHRQA